MPRKSVLCSRDVAAVVTRRAAGESLHAIALELRVSEVYLRVATNRVKNDDLDSLSGADRAAAVRRYWPHVWCANA